MKKVIAIIGCGRIANGAHLPPLSKMEDVKIKYVCDLIPEKAEKATEKPSEPKNQPEPVYFIVERKKKRAKSSYTEPKEIRFK